MTTQKKLRLVVWDGPAFNDGPYVWVEGEELAMLPPELRPTASGVIRKRIVLTPENEALLAKAGIELYWPVR